MTDLKVKRHWWHPGVQRVAASNFGSWLLRDRLGQIDKPLLRLTNNRLSLTSLLAGLPVIVLETIGAKTGLSRQTPLAAIPDGEKIILIASNFGNHRHPAWYYNLKANPAVKVIQGNMSAGYLACQAFGEEREQYWKKAVEMYGGYQAYEQKAGDREIPVIVLEPISE